jgi:hypothetical protein
MSLADHFPQGDKDRCPICGTKDDKPCFLIPIDGTQKGNTCQAAPIHADCIREQLERFRYNRSVGIVYAIADKEK